MEYQESTVSKYTFDQDIMKGGYPIQPNDTTANLIGGKIGKTDVFQSSIKRFEHLSVPIGLVNVSPKKIQSMNYNVNPEIECIKNDDFEHLFGLATHGRNQEKRNKTKSATKPKIKVRVSKKKRQE